MIITPHPHSSPQTAAAVPTHHPADTHPKIPPSQVQVQVQVQPSPSTQTWTWIFAAAQPSGPEAYVSQHPNTPRPRAQANYQATAQSEQGQQRMRKPSPAGRAHNSDAGIPPTASQQQPGRSRRRPASRDTRSADQSAVRRGRIVSRSAGRRD